MNRTYKLEDKNGFPMSGIITYPKDYNFISRMKLNNDTARVCRASLKKHFFVV